METFMEIQSFLDNQLVSLCDKKKFLEERKRKEILQKQERIENKYSNLVEKARRASQEICCQNVLLFVRQKRERFEECLKLLQDNKSKNLELELLEIGKEISDLFTWQPLFTSASKYKFWDNTVLPFKEVGLGPELRDFQDLIKEIWKDRLTRRKRIFGKPNLKQYQPWFVFLSEVNHEITIPTK
jgi:hypothetical protein